MKQVTQNVRSGETLVVDVPDPIAAPGQVVIRARASLLSAGTERYVIDLARKSLLEKARARPDHVARIMQKLRQEGLGATITQVLNKLDEPMTLGYSCAGDVVACGLGVQEFKPGDRVAAAGPHAQIVSVGRNLCVGIPDNVSYEQAAYGGIGAIAMEGIRLAQPALGDRVLVIGLGLIGQISVALLRAHGCRVFGTDVDPKKIAFAREVMNLDDGGLGSPTEAVASFTQGHGVDAVLITAATASDEPIRFAAEACRSKGKIVLVGVIGLNVPRELFFRKELTFAVSASLGPGRWDPTYEERGVDYPIGHVRWTAQRNMEAVLGAISRGDLPAHRLTTHRFSVEQAAAAYDLIVEGSTPHYGVLLQYGTNENVSPTRTRELRQSRPARNGAIGVSVIGAGNFARAVMLPGLQRATGVALRGVCTARGLSAVHAAERGRFSFATTDVDVILNDTHTDAVLIMTRHDLHADLVVRALRAGKHVFVEKPLAISVAELRNIDECVGELAEFGKLGELGERGELSELGERCPILTVGFNRRFAKATSAVTQFLADVREPLSISFRFTTAKIDAKQWPQDETIGGGRIVGEACHAIDLCSAIASSPPVRVFAESATCAGGLSISDDRIFITLRHANGSVSSISYQAGGDRGGPKERLEVFGGGRTAIINDWDGIELWHDGRQRRQRGGKNRGHRDGLRAFLESARSGGPWPIAWSTLHAVSLASLMAVRSLREGDPQDVPARDS